MLRAGAPLHISLTDLFPNDHPQAAVSPTQGRREMATAKKASTRPESKKNQEATALLRADHKQVSQLFEEFEKARSTTRKQGIVANICRELTVHALIEEEIFYPAVKKALKDSELVPEATVEHATLKDLISQLDGVAAGGEMYDAKVKVLSEYVEHHVKEEQNEMFPKVRKSKLDLNALGAALAARKQAMLAAYR
jgi:hemerythrin superfamily protein